MGLFIVVLIIVGFTNAHSSETVRAQNTAVTPTLYCLAASCPGTSTTPIATPSAGISTTVSLTPSLTSQPSIVTTSIAPSPSQPCSSSSLSSLTSALQAPAEKGGKGGHFGGRGGRGGGRDGERGGFLGSIFKFLLLLIDIILKLVGSGGLSQPCAPSVSVTPAPPISPVLTSGTITPSGPVTTTLAPTSTSATSSSTTTGIGSGTSIFTGPFGNTCNPGQLYCNGHVITGGQNNTLYNCQPHSAPTVQKTCPGACKVNSSGNDSC
jgi:hypothetical protein